MSNNRRSSLFSVGGVFNPIRFHVWKKSHLAFREVVLRYPSRLNAMAIDPGLIAPKKDMHYTAGEVVFSIALEKQVRIVARRDGQICISPRTKRPALARHAALIMREAIGFKEGFDIEVKNATEMRHCGLGSSSGLIASVAVAVNEAYGNPIPRELLIRYLAQNHGEEVDGRDDVLNCVQSIGGSAVAGLCAAGMVVLAGDAIPIATIDIPRGYKAVIGVPEDYREMDSKVLMEKELKAMKGFVATGKRYGPANAYNVLHRMLPAMREGDLATIGDVIFEYRYNMGSIRNCAFTYPKLEKVFATLIPLKKRGIAPILSISSVGPGMFAITKDSAVCADAFRAAGLSARVVPICNTGYRLIHQTHT